MLSKSITITDIKAAQQRLLGIAVVNLFTFYYKSETISKSCLAVIISTPRNG